MSPEEMPVSLSSPAEEFRAGVLAKLPLLLGVVPFGLIYGVLGLAAGLPGLAAVVMCSVLFAGSSQIVFAQLSGAQAPVRVIGATVGMVNLRHAIYSASVAPYLRELSLRWKFLLSYLLTDEAYAAAIGRLLAQGMPHKLWIIAAAPAGMAAGTWSRSLDRRARA